MNTEKIFGRFLENLGIALIAGAVIGFNLFTYQYIFLLITGTILTILGAFLYEKF